jgi:hypothetical protein
MSDLSKEDLGALSLVPNESNIFSWRATLPGPAGSPYEGGEFEVDIRIPEDYPYVHCFSFLLSDLWENSCSDLLLHICSS